MQVEMTPADTDSFAKIVSTRRSVRIFDKTPIPEPVMERCLDIALLAPNSSNLQPWEFHWVRSQPQRAKLVEACLSQAAAATASDLIVCVARTDTWRQNRQQMLESLARHQKEGVKIPRAAVHYYEKLVPFAYNLGPLGIMGVLKRFIAFFGGLKKPITVGPKSRHELQLWATKTTALGCENLMLALRAFGYDSCPMEGFDQGRVRKLLNLKSGASVVMVIAAGKRATNGVTVPHIRGDRSQFIKYV